MATLKIDPDGVAHLPGCALNTFKTLCGDCNSSTPYEDAEGTPTCQCCITAAQEILAAATASEIKSWSKRRPRRAAAVGSGVQNNQN
jgi:hypothetical protein